MKQNIIHEEIRLTVHDVEDLEAEQDKIREKLSELPRGLHRIPKGVAGDKAIEDQIEEYWNIRKKLSTLGRQKKTSRIKLSNLVDSVQYKIFA